MKKLSLLLAVLLHLTAFSQKNHRTRPSLMRHRPTPNVDLSQQRTESVCVKDSDIIASRSSTSSTWGDISKIEYGYDAHLNVNFQQTSHGFPSNWLPSDRQFNTYDQNNNMLSSISQSFNYNTWQNNDMVVYTYTTANQPLSELHSLWNSTSWQNWFRQSYTYNQQNLLTQLLSETWNSSSSSWTGSQRENYTYNGNNINTEISQTWTNSAWLNTDKYIYMYDIFNNLISVTYQTWVPSSSTWLNVEQQSATYTGTVVSTVTTTEWSGTSWVNSEKFIGTFDANNNMLTATDQLWDASASNWVNDTKSTYTYTLQNKPLSGLDQNWNGTSWENQDRTTFTYDSHYNQLTQTYEDWMASSSSWTGSGQRTSSYYNCTAVGIKELAEPFKELVIYPNPASSSLHVASGISYAGISILNISGQEVLHREEGITEVPVSHLSEGLYFIRLLDQKGTVVATNKFIKQ